MNNSQSFWLRPAVLKAYLLFFCIGVVVVSLGRPDHIWDTISYTSLAKEKDFESVEALHKEAFDSLIATVGEERFQSMLGQHHPEFRQAMYEDTEVFKQQLNFFRTRLLLTSTVRLIDKTTGISPRVGGTVVAGICAALGFWVMAMLFFQKVPRAAVYLFPIVGILFGVISLGRASSPDGMSFLFIALSCYFFFKGPKHAAVGGCCPNGCDCVGRFDGRVFISHPERIQSLGLSSGGSAFLRDLQIRQSRSRSV
ncbi:hypothetical protein OAE25_01420 [Verrucomicrobiales bacterium]|jgi:hypothetical protein|nr:hypothetical protein [bacterium]MDB4617306.1 hypothetical protein [Verrucomicrobiales bacterium]MDC0259506.1 hypothetical protein [Verrucomicrobiales bacterium]